MSVPSQVPARLPAGQTTDPPYQPLADCGNGNPLFYHQFYDDFDNSLGATGLYTTNGTSGATYLHTAGDGGLATLTTAAASGDYAQIQLPQPSFTLPYSAGAPTGKKLFFLVRLELSDATNSALVVGLINSTTNLTTGITDGLYFSKASGSTTNLNFISAVASSLTTTPVPTSAYTLANATFVDLGFYVDWNGNVNVFSGYPLIGYNPQSGSGSGGPYVSSGVYGAPQVGRVLQLTAPVTLSTANLSPSLCVSAGAAATKSVTIDGWVTSKER